MTEPPSRPVLDSLEVRSPRVAAAGVRVLTRLPPTLRRRILAGARDRAANAFNRGDLAAVFALFAEDVEYVAPPALYGGQPLVGRGSVFDFWRDVFVRFERNTIVNLSIEEANPSRFIRSALLSHRGGRGPLEYVIRQTTELCDGLVVRQVNEHGS